MPGAKLYNEAQRAEFIPPPCPKDGSQVIFGWLDMETMGSGPVFAVQPRRCTNDACEMSDPDLRADWGPAWNAVTDED